MSREIKFRYTRGKEIYYFTLDELCVEVKDQLEFRGQYTGLKDKNGTEIYEGDIVELDDEWYDVVFGDGRFAVEHVGGLFGQHKKCTVVGNIHEDMEETDNV